MQLYPVPTSEGCLGVDAEYPPPGDAKLCCNCAGGPGTDRSHPGILKPLPHLERKTRISAALSVLLEPG